MTFEEAIPRLKKNIYAVEHKLLSFPRFMNDVDSTLSPLDIRNLPSYTKFRMFRDKYSAFSFTDNNGNSVDFQTTETINSIKTLIGDLEKALIETPFTKNVGVSVFTLKEKIEGLRELKGKTLIESLNIPIWLFYLQQTISSVFGFTSKESREMQQLIGEFQFDLDNQLFPPKELDLRYKIKSLHYLDIFIETLESQAPKPTNTKSIQLKKLPIGTWGVIFAVALPIIGGAYLWGKDNGLTKYDEKKIELSDSNKLLKDETKQKSDTISSLRIQVGDANSKITALESELKSKQTIEK